MEENQDRLCTRVPQAPIEKEMYMKIPAGVDIIEGEKTDFVLKMLRNIYGQKQAGRVWNKYCRFHIKCLRF